MVAQHLTRTGRPEEALVKLREAQALLDAGTMVRVEYADEIKRDLGEAEARCGDRSTGERLLRQALRILEERSGPEHRATALARLKLARVVAATNPVEGAQLACRAARDLRSAVGEAHRETRGGCPEAC